MVTGIEGAVGAHDLSPAARAFSAAPDPDHADRSTRPTDAAGPGRPVAG